jgi:hypothetical protein
MATDPSTVDLHGSASRRPSAEMQFFFAKKCQRAVAQRAERSDNTARSQVPTKRAQQKAIKAAIAFANQTAARAAPNHFPGRLNSTL